MPMPHFLSRTTMALLCSAMIVGACSSDTISNRMTGGQIDARNAQVQSQSLNLANEMANLQATGRPSNINVNDGIFLGREGVRANNGDPLPRQFEGPRGISVNLGNRVNIRQFSETIERMTRIPVDWSDLAAASFDSGVGDDTAQSQASATADSASPGQPFQVPVSGSSGGDDGDHIIDITFRVNHTGSLSDLLTFVASRLSADWTYRGGRIQFLGPQTRTYTLWAMPTTQGTESSVGTGGGGAFGGGGAQVSTRANYAYEYWETIENGLAAILPVAGARYSVNRSAGTIVVTGSQAAHNRVADFIANENRRLSRQVSVKVDVIAFTQTDSSNMAGDMSLLLRTLGSGMQISGVGAPQVVQGSSNIRGTVVRPDGRIDGSSAVIQTLSRYGRVSNVASQSLVAMNNAPTPLALQNQRAYLQRVEVTESDSGPITTLQDGLITTGINLVVTPRVMSSGDVLVQYTLSSTDLKGIEQFQTPDGANAIQLPETETRTFMQTVNIASGDTLIIAAFDNERSQRESSGPFSAAFWGLGGRSHASNEQSRILIMMTPVVLEGRNSPGRR